MAHCFNRLTKGTVGEILHRTFHSTLPASKRSSLSGATVYVATDEGVLVSQNGEHWRVLTDKMGDRPAIDRFAVDHTDIYGAGNAGIYRLDTHSKWEQISPSIRHRIDALVVGNNKLYIDLMQGGMSHISLEKLQ